MRQHLSFLAAVLALSSCSLYDQPQTRQQSADSVSVEVNIDSQRVRPSYVIVDWIDETSVSRPLTKAYFATNVDPQKWFDNVVYTQDHKMTSCRYVLWDSLSVDYDGRGSVSQVYADFFDCEKNRVSRKVNFHFDYAEGLLVGVRAECSDTTDDRYTPFSGKAELHYDQSNLIPNTHSLAPHLFMGIFSGCVRIPYNGALGDEFGDFLPNSMTYEYGNVIETEHYSYNIDRARNNLVLGYTVKVTTRTVDGAKCNPDQFINVQFIYRDIEPSSDWTEWHEYRQYPIPTPMDRFVKSANCSDYRQPVRSEVIPTKVDNVDIYSFDGLIRHTKQSVRDESEVSYYTYRPLIINRNYAHSHGAKLDDAGRIRQISYVETTYGGGYTSDYTYSYDQNGHLLTELCDTKYWMEGEPDGDLMRSQAYTRYVYDELGNVKKRIVVSDSLYLRLNTTVWARETATVALSVYDRFDFPNATNLPMPANRYADNPFMFTRMLGLKSANLPQMEQTTTFSYETPYSSVKDLTIRNPFYLMVKEHVGELLSGEYSDGIDRDMLEQFDHITPERTSVSYSYLSDDQDRIIQIIPDKGLRHEVKYER